MIDPAVIAVVAASSAIRKQQGGPVTLRDIALSFAVVFGIAALVVAACWAYIQMGIRHE